MAIMAAAAPYLAAASAAATIGGTIIQANAARSAGQAQQNEANYEAAQLRENADEQQAAAEQKVVQQNKQTAYVLSNARAAAAAGGGSATDPTVETNLQTIAGEGRYRALTDMYQGDAAARQLNMEATAKQYGGNIAAQAGNTRAFSTILSGASSLFQKYGNISSGGGTTVPGVDTTQTSEYNIPQSAYMGR